MKGTLPGPFRHPSRALFTRQGLSLRVGGYLDGASARRALAYAAASIAGAAP